MRGAEAAPQKLMDRLAAAPPGDPLNGVLTTTFELQPDFVETDYLPTLFALGAWDDRAWSSRVAVERRLAELQAATIFFAAERYHGRPRSLRIEVVPVHKRDLGVLHAKVSLFVHEASVRLLVTSANLTEPGYRRNREVAVSLLASEKRPQQAPLIRGCLQRMPEVLADWWGAGAERLAGAASQLLDAWAPETPDAADEWFAWGGTNSPLWRQFLDRWPDGEVVQDIAIVSPFWSASTRNGPLERLLHELKSRGALATGARLRLLTEAHPDAAGSVRPVLPETYASFDLRSTGVIATAQAVDPAVSREESAGADDRRPRPLHAKVVLLEGSRTTLAYTGSANFTRRGWGFLPRPESANIEAGLILRRTGKSREAIRALVPPARGAAVPLDGAAGDRIAVAGEEAPARVWPSFVRRVELVPSADRPNVQDLYVTLDESALNGAWSISVDGTGEEGTLLRSSDGSAHRDGAPGGPRRVSLTDGQHTRLLIAQYVLVRWWGSAGAVEYPLNVDESARADLPLAPGAGKPGEHLLLQYYQSRIAFEDLFPPQDGLADDVSSGGGERGDEPGADTSAIQSYQIREFVEALRGIQDDLRRASTAPAAMRLALLGAVSPVALADTVTDAVRSRSRTPTAAAFQLVEILACLGGARKFEVPERHRDAWGRLVDDAIGRVEVHLKTLRAQVPNALNGDTPFARYERAVRKLHGLVTTVAA